MKNETWTKELPKESGFYWHRSERDDVPEVVFYDTEMEWMTSCGNDIPRGPDMSYKITGEFSPRILPPEL